jgi:hypothetical protein
MTDDTQVAQLLRDATADLRPAPGLVAGLVAGGVARGRSRRRRHLAGMTLASVALIGAAAAVVPQLLPAGGATPGHNDFATSPSVTPVPHALPGHRVPIKADRGANTLVHLLPNGSVSSPTNDAGVEPGEVASRVVYAGGTVEATVVPLHSQADIDKAKQLGSLLSSARDECGFGHDDACTRLPDGSYFRAVTSTEREPGSPDVRQTRATLWTTDGYVVEVIAFDARPFGEDGIVSAPNGAIVLTAAQLQEIASSPDWFRAAS